MENIEGKIRHAGCEAEARGGPRRARQVRLAAAVAAPAEGAPQQRGGWKEAEESGWTEENC